MTRSPLLLLLTFAGCVDSAEAPPTTEPVRYPGYCTAQTELDGEEGADGLRTATYDAEGRLLFDEFDSDLDGDADVVNSYEYDSDGQLVLQSIDRFADGEIDEVRQYAWDEGRMTHEARDVDLDGNVDLFITFQHDEAGRRVRGEGHSDDDEELEYLMRFDYSDDLLIALYIDGIVGGGLDGRWDTVIFYEHDAAGNTARALYDLDGDGVTNLVVTFDYACWI